jgi:hypothetical protein
MICGKHKMFDSGSFTDYVQNIFHFDKYWWVMLKICTETHMGLLEKWLLKLFNTNEN